MRKKIAIVFNRMIVGGVEKALLNFLRAIDTERYDVTLFTFNDKARIMMSCLRTLRSGLQHVIIPKRSFGMISSILGLKVLQTESIAES